MKEVDQIIVTECDINKSKSHVFCVEHNGDFFQTVYPEPLGELSAYFEHENDAYYELIMDRISQKYGSKWPINDPLNAAQKLWEVLEDYTVDEDDNIEKAFLHFEAGTDRFTIWHWFESYFGVSIVEDLESTCRI